MTGDNKGRKAREEATRRDHILSVSERLFAKQGLHNTSVADIAKEAEFGIGTIYKYFKDKTTLIQSLMEHRVNSHFSALKAALESEGSPVDKINRLIDAYFDSVNKDMEFFSMYYTHFHPGPKDDPHAGSLNLEFVQKQKLKCIEMTTEVFSDGIRRGYFVGLDPEYLGAALLGMMISFFCFADGKFETERNVDNMSESVKKIFFNSVLIEGEKPGDDLSRTFDDSKCVESTGETI